MCLQFSGVEGTGSNYSSTHSCKFCTIQFITCSLGAQHPAYDCVVGFFKSHLRVGKDEHLKNLELKFMDE